MGNHDFGENGENGKNDEIGENGDLVDLGENGGFGEIINGLDLKYKWRRMLTI